MGDTVPAGNGNPNGNSGDKYRYAWYATWLLQHKYRDVPLLGVSDLKDSPNLATRLKNATPSHQISQYLREQLSSEARQLLEEYDPADAPSDELKLLLVDMLNKLIRGEGEEVELMGLFLRISPFRGYSEDTREVGENYQEKQELIRYNRMVLEDVYPDEIDRLPRGFWQHIGPVLSEWFKRTFEWPGDKVWVDAEGKRVMLDDKVLYTGEDVKWEQAPIFSSSDFKHDGERYYKFAHIPPWFLEGWAWHSSWGNDAVNTIWHMTQMQPGHQVSSILNGVYDLGHGATKILGRQPISGFGSYKNRWLEWLLKWLEWLPPVPILYYASGLQIVLTSLGSLQGRQTVASPSNRYLFHLTVWLADFLNLSGPVSAMKTIRNFSLSFMTLLNFAGEGSGEPLPSPPAENRKEIDGVLDAVVVAFSYWLASYVDREEYGHPGIAPGDVYLLWLLGGFGMGIFSWFTGTVIALIMAWAEDWDMLFSLPALGTAFKSVLKTWLLFWPLAYSLHEGDTDDGRYNPVGADFRGYPSKTDANGSPTPSPYLLPYEAGNTLFIGQGNQGIFSHNFLNGAWNLYAFDFGHDQAEEVLACRPGTVVSFFEGTVDDTTGPWNFIVIRHDVNDDGNPIAPDPAHDRDANGRTVVTFAVYGHGRQNGVTDAFSNAGLAAPTLGVTRVRRGQPIMLAGDTGVSFHNHLHMAVQPQNLNVYNVHVGSASGGTFTLSVGAATTADIAWDASAADVQAALQAVGVAATVNGSGSIANPWNITFTAAPASFTIDETNLTPAPAGARVNATRNTNYSIPFIFQDVDGNGVPENLTWHTSTNTRVT
jgi:hypothetical protein